MKKSKPTKEAKKAVRYERSVPRCQNCRWYKSAGVKRAQCTTHEFCIEPQGCCDTWESKEGVRLEVVLEEAR